MSDNRSHTRAAAHAIPSVITTPLPVLHPGVSLALLKRVWRATRADLRRVAPDTFSSRICLRDGWVRLDALTAKEASGLISAVTYEFIVQHFDTLLGRQHTPFLNHSDAVEFALTVRTAAGVVPEVRSLTGARR